MSRGPLIVILGFAVLVVGLFLLAIPGLGSGSTFVFVFPFFFGSTSPLMAMMIGLAVFLLMVSVVVLMIRQVWNPPLLRGGKDHVFVPVTGDCPVCGSSLPENASFCPHCGSPIQIGDR